MIFECFLKHHTENKVRHLKLIFSHNTYKCKHNVKTVKLSQKKRNNYIENNYFQYLQNK